MLISWPEVVTVSHYTPPLLQSEGENAIRILPYWVLLREVATAGSVAVCSTIVAGVSAAVSGVSALVLKRSNWSITVSIG